MNYKDKTIWITGASSGIGKAVALECSGECSKLILSGRNKESLEEVAAQCKLRGAETLVLVFDLGNESESEDAARKVIHDHPEIHCLFHFGGISQRSLTHETPLDVDRKIFEVNYFGTINITKPVLNQMISNGGGQIAVTSSLVGKFGFPYRSSYSASKQALHGYFESLRAEHVQNNIKVSMIIPGRIKTNISLNAIDKDGKAHGQMDQGQEMGKDVGETAKTIYRKLKREKKEILVGGKELLMVHIRRFLPWLYYKMASKIKPT